MKRTIISIALIVFGLLVFSSPVMAKDAKHCIQFNSDTIANTCWEKVSVAWCYSKHDDSSVRCRTAPGERKFTQNIVLEARQTRSIAEPTAATRIPFAACEGDNSIEVNPGRQDRYVCKEVQKNAVSFSLDL